MPPTRKDVVIAFGGRVDPSLRAAANQTERETLTLRQRLGRSANVVQGFGQGLGGRLSTGISAGLAGGLAGAGAYAGAALGVSLIKATGATEALAKAFGIVTQHAREMANSFKAISDAFQAQTTKMVQGEVGPAREASERAFSRFSLPGGFPTSLFGSLAGQRVADIRKIQESRDKLARERSGGATFGQLRAKYMQQELDNQFTVWGATPDDYLGGLSDTIYRGIGLPEVADDRARKRERDIMEGLRSRAGARALRDVRGRDRSLQRADDELALQQNRIRGLMGLEAGAAGLGARFRVAGMDFSQLGGQVGGIFSRTFGGAFGGISESLAMNRAMRLQTESPAEALRRELGNLEAMRGQGLSEEQFRRRRMQLRMGAIGSLPGPQQTPTLAATEGRFITMGRRSPEVDELSALRRELKMHTEKQTSALVSAIRESGGESDSL